MALLDICHVPHVVLHWYLLTAGMPIMTGMQILTKSGCIKIDYLHASTSELLAIYWKHYRDTSVLATD